MAKKPLVFSTPYSDRTAADVQKAYESLSFWKKLVLRFWGPVLIGAQTHPGWTGSLRHYLAYCPAEHIVSENHPQGYNDRIDCPVCRSVLSCLR